MGLWKQKKQDKKTKKNKVVFGNDIYNKFIVYVSCLFMVDKIK